MWFGNAMQTGPRYVPLLRISLLQLEMVWIAIRDGTAVQQQQDNKVMDEADKEAMAARRVSLACICFIPANLATTERQTQSCLYSDSIYNCILFPTAGSRSRVTFFGI